MGDDRRSRLSRRGFLGASASAAGLLAASAARAEQPPGAPLGPGAAGVQGGPGGAGWTAEEPYARLNGGRFAGPRVRASRDPLVRYRWPSPAAGDELQVYAVTPISATTDAPASFRNLRSATRPRCAVEVRGTGSIRFDFGVESPGWLEFDSADLAQAVDTLDGVVELSISEYDEPAVVNPGPPHPVKTLTPQRHGDTFRLELNPDLYEGVRFGWIHVRAFDRPWRITAVRCVAQAKPVNYAGSFACSDPQLTELWYAGAYSVRAGFQRDYMAPILMDRGDRYGWAGDCNPIQSAAMVAFGNWDYVKANLDRTVDSAFGIEPYSLYWVLGLLEYHRCTGDAATLEQHVANVQAKLDHGADIYADPSITFLGWDERLGAGFEAANRPETKAAYRMLFIRACREFADATAAVGRAEDGARYGRLADAKAAELRADPDWFRALGVHALSDAISAGCVTPDERDAVFAHEFADRLNRLSFSNFNQYFILQGLAGLGRFDEAFVTARDNWGGQLAYGGTTYFEVFHPSWLDVLGDNDPVPNSQSGWTSLAHPWGGGVTAWLSREVLGIRPASPGYADVDVFPQLGTTLRWVSGSVPTPHGDVSAAFDVASGSGLVRIPAGSSGRVGIPSDGRTVTRVQVNGRTAWDGRARRVPGIGGVSLQDGTVVLEGVQPGSHRIVSHCGGRRPAAFRPQPIEYPARVLAHDTTTGGDWGGVYGRDGHVLFDYDGIGRHRQALPGYVVSVVPWRSGYQDWSNCRDAVWEAQTSERRALAPDGSNAFPRAAACIYSTTPSPGGMTMAVDLSARAGAEYELALYFVDWDRKGRRVAVELFDLDARKRLAPVQLVDDFGDGAWLVYACVGSVRLRIAHVRGDNAVLSGLLFDPPGSPA